jgi:hypothetical protein
MSDDEQALAEEKGFGGHGRRTGGVAGRS